MNLTRVEAGVFSRMSGGRRGRMLFVWLAFGAERAIRHMSCDVGTMALVYMSGNVPHLIVTSLFVLYSPLTAQPRLLDPDRKRVFEVAVSPSISSGCPLGPPDSAQNTLQYGPRCTTDGQAAARSDSAILSHFHVAELANGRPGNDSLGDRRLVESTSRTAPFGRVQGSSSLSTRGHLTLASPSDASPVTTQL